MEHMARIGYVENAGIIKKGDKYGNHNNKKYNSNTVYDIGIIFYDLCIIYLEQENKRIYLK